MARIRTIKPEFWSSPGIETLEYRWRLLYIGLWQLADDFGRGSFNPREFLGFVFPADMSEDSGGIRRGCGELRRVFGVEFYSVGGIFTLFRRGRSIRRRIVVPKLLSIRHRGRGFLLTRCLTSLYLMFWMFPPTFRRVPPGIRRVPPESPGIPALEQGNRGTVIWGLRYLVSCRLSKHM